MLPWSAELAGRLDEHVIDSELLRDNPLGDPARRPLWVYVPPGYDDSAQRYPSVYVIQGYTGHLEMWRNRSAYRRPFPETADALFAAGGTPPAVLVFVDAWMAYGGSQFVDSSGTGRYHSSVVKEAPGPGSGHPHAPESHHPRPGIPMRPAGPAINANTVIQPDSCRTHGLHVRHSADRQRTPHVQQASGDGQRPYKGRRAAKASFNWYSPMDGTR